MDLNDIFMRARKGEEITKEECIQLLSLDDSSKEVLAMMVTATDIIRKRNNNSAYIFSGIGVHYAPCAHNCSFCPFAKDNTSQEIRDLSDDEIVQRVKELEINNDIYGIYLVMTPNYELDRLIECIRLVKSTLRGPVKLFSSVGDATYRAFRRMREAGLDGVFQSWRLGEGERSPITSDIRKATMNNARRAGLEILNAVEPIRIDDDPEEIAERIFYSKKMGVLQSGAMRTICVPNAPCDPKTRVSPVTLSKIVAAMVLAFASMERMPIMTINDPDMMGFISGANMVFSNLNEGWNIEMCKDLLREAGFTKLMLSDGTTKPL